MRHLTTRLVVLLMLALMAISGVYDYVRLSGERDRLVHQTGEDQRIFAETLALAVRQNVRRGRTTEELQELLDDIRARPALVWVAIYDPRGQVVASSLASGAPPPTGDALVDRVLESRTSVASVIEEGDSQTRRYVQPFRWPGGRTGAIEVRQSLRDVERRFARAIRESIVYRLVVLVFFAICIGALTRWSITRPIRSLIEGARAVGGGDLTRRIAVARPNEIGELAEEFNRMAESLQQARAALVEQSEARLRLEREVLQAQKLAAVGMLAAEVAHEVGTPLNVIVGRAEVLGRVMPADHPGRRHLEAIRAQADRITGIIRSLLDYTRPRRPTPREESIAPLLGRVVDLVEGRYRVKGIRIRVDLPPVLPAILGDRDQLQQLFVNVLTNALDATPPGGTIRVTEGPDPVLPPQDRTHAVRGKADAPWLAIHIVDEGVGLTGDEVAHVFEPFFSTKKRGQGTGLGLPIVEEIVRAHRGEVEMLSIPGRGTEVVVRLPLAPETAAEGPEAQAPAATEHGR